MRITLNFNIVMNKGSSQMAQYQRICLPMHESWVQSLYLEDPLEKEMAAHFNILAKEIP